MVFAKDADDCLIIEYSGGAEEKVIFHMDVKTGNILAIDKMAETKYPISNLHLEPGMMK